ncbi:MULTISPECIES: CDP-glycerol glycerophosphotransferase family protein [Mammaliicoccus]|uniref:CDP-glycerol glycerophosphotransferase family protein n=1 Tax=Mammaliicoccus TaxID=2803850 RepID=UPI0009929D83|nr:MULTISPECIES: CDP-glycerol glycerophosphotransferase family protein [Mammaliicoccus]OOV76427.1 glycosyl transferase family 1 [Mammaliicoccus fleurettii]
MHVKILGFNLFAKGGTSRSNINLIKAFVKSGYKVTYYNFKDYNQSDLFNTMINEGLLDDNLEFQKYIDAKELGDCDKLILTRETFFYIARDVKQVDKKVQIIGEIHGPLAYISDEADLATDAIDAFRVSTAKIKEDFIEKYDVNYVFNQYVEASHINLSLEPKNTKRNLLIKARFEDEIKDISYVIKLMNCIVNVKGYEDINLYIKGYGPSEVLYNNLVKYYGLKNNVHINKKEPLTYIYVSSSPYETLGYSILESIAEGNKAFIYTGKDDVLNDIYNSFRSIKFMQKNIEIDCNNLINFINEKYTKKDRVEDVEKLKAEFLDRNYADDFLNNATDCINNSKEKIINNKIIKNKNQNKNENLDKFRDLYEKLKEKPVLNKIMQNDKIFGYAKNKYLSKKVKNEMDMFNQIVPSSNKVFIESFHGNNFSGDPKYIALYIREHFPEKQVFVSSRNSLVDIEIRNCDVTPIRFGSTAYSKIFRECKYVFVNGNTLDKVYKHDDQVFIQTWHGLPLKRMVNDLTDVKERNDQVNAFLPRMQKWDYLLSSSLVNTMLFKSAFLTKNNSNLKILEYGAPRNEYLLNDNEDEKRRIMSKYFFTNVKNKKYILFCPTWRKEKRQNLSSINLKKLLGFLPDEYEIIVKLHPNEAHLRGKYSNLDKRIHCFFNEFVDIQELYLISDSMLTDYSSTIFDYAHLNKPIILIQEDTQSYNEKVGFYFDIFELGSFPIANMDERRLAQQLTNFEYMNYSKMTNRLLTYDSKESTKMILDTVFDEK